jgi:hypothetical protein
LLAQGLAQGSGLSGAAVFLLLRTMEGAMPQTDQLTALKVSRAKPKRRPDGTLIGYRLPDKKQTGLYLAVSATGAKSWVYMWERNGKRRVMGLGSEKALSLANAREDAAEAYRDVRKGLDPIAERNKRKGHSITFAEAAAACLGQGSQLERQASAEFYAAPRDSRQATTDQGGQPNHP